MVDQVSFQGLVASNHNTNYTANAAVFTGVNGALTVNSNLYLSATGNLVVSNGFSYTTAATDLVDAIYYLDDISSTFDGSTTTFNLTYNNGTFISPLVPTKVQVYIGGMPVMPARQINDYFNLTEISVFNKGFIVSSNAAVNTITFATAPSRGMDFTGLVRSQNPSVTFKYNQSPFSALNIMFGP
jgi:hypothetical protein